MTVFLMSLAFAGGYAASIYSWPAIKLGVMGAKAEILALEVKILALKAKL